MQTFWTRRVISSRRRLASAALLQTLVLIPGCTKRETAGGVSDSSISIATPGDSVTYQTSWNMGRDLDEPENSYNSRFSVRVRQVSSGRLDVLLSSDSLGRSIVADSVGVNGVTLADHFTEGCLRDKNSNGQVIGIVRDSVHERRSHPRFAWSIDTLSRKIIGLSPDSVVCFIAGPE